MYIDYFILLLFKDIFILHIIWVYLIVVKLLIATS